MYHLTVLVSVLGVATASQFGLGGPSQDGDIQCSKLRYGVINDTTMEILVEQKELCSTHCYIRTYITPAGITNITGGCDISNIQNDLTYCDTSIDWDKRVCMTAQDKNTKKNTRLCCCHYDDCTEMHGQITYANGGGEYEFYENGMWVVNESWVVAPELDVAKLYIRRLPGGVGAGRNKAIDEWADNENSVNGWTKKFFGLAALITIFLY